MSFVNCAPREVLLCLCSAILYLGKDKGQEESNCIVNSDFSSSPHRKPSFWIILNPVESCWWYNTSGHSYMQKYKNRTQGKSLSDITD